MHAIDVYESRYGNARHIAEAIARGLEISGTVRVLPVSAAVETEPSGYDIIDKDTHLLPGEEERAQTWGEDLAVRARG